MNFEIRPATRCDLPDILRFTYDKEPIMDNSIREKYAKLLKLGEQCLLLAFFSGKLSGLLTVSVIDGIGKDFPFAVLSGAKIKSGLEKSGIDRALIEQAQYIAAQYGCKRIIGYAKNRPSD